MEVYKEYSRIVVEVEEGVNSTLNLWKCFRTGEITTYSLASEYLFNEKEDLEFSRFIKYLKIDTSDKDWNKKSALVISEETIPSPSRYGDGEYITIYNFHWLVGSKLNIISFNPQNLYVVE